MRSSKAILHEEYIIKKQISIGLLATRIQYQAIISVQILLWNAELGDGRSTKQYATDPSNKGRSVVERIVVLDSTFGSVQFTRSVVSDSLRRHEQQQPRPPCPSPTPGVHPNPCPSSWWCHPTISSSVVPFSSCPQSFPASGSFQMSQLFSSGGQSTGVSASASVPPMNTQDWSPLGWTGWISLQSKGLARVFSNTPAQSINSSVFSFLYTLTLTSIHDLWKHHSLN